LHWQAITEAMAATMAAGGVAPIPVSRWLLVP
jgi:hypothetical protein